MYIQYVLDSIENWSRHTFNEIKKIKILTNHTDYIYKWSVCIKEEGHWYLLKFFISYRNLYIYLFI